MTIYRRLFGAEAVTELFSAAATVQRMLDFEAALASAEAQTGIIPDRAAAPIVSQCRANLFDLEGLADRAGRAGNLAIPVVEQLTALVSRVDREAAAYVHWGATSQDAIDSGLILQLRDALSMIDRELDQLRESVLTLAKRHRATSVVARTWMQHAIPTVLGLQFAGWADALDRHAQRLRDTRRRAAVLQFGGAAGTLAPFGDRGLAVGAAIAATLGLELPRLSWHAHRDRIAEVATTLALLAGTLGKIARDIAIQSQTELAELREPSELGRGGSSSMPHKRNPVSSAVALAAAVRIPGLAAGILAGMVQEHERGLGGWQAEWESVPELVCLCAGSLHHVRHTVDGLIVNAARMQANLEASRGLIYSEAVTMALAKHIGRADARTLVERAAGRAAAEGRQLREVLQSDAAVTTHLTGGDLARLFDPQAQLGVSHELIDRVVHSPDRKRVRHETSSAARFVEVGGHRTRYEVLGPVDGPVLVLSNSLGANLAMWDPQVAALAGRWRIVRYDTRGHGGSSVTPGPYSIAQLADDVISLLDHLGVEQADWCGLSMGGMIGLRLAVDHPERVGKLVVCSSAAQIGTPASWADRITAVRRGGTEAIVGSVMTRWFSDGFRARDPDTVERIARQFVATSADGYAACCAAIRDADLRDVVGTIRAPTLVVAATEDPVISTEAVRWLADHIPGARYGELPTAHLSNVEDSVAFTSLVSHFLSA